MTDQARLAILAAICFFAGLVADGKGVAIRQAAKTSGQTIRHHKVSEVDGFSPEIREAESAIDKKDYAAAEKLLISFSSKDPNNYRAWFDLGYIYTALDKGEDSIAAYRKAVAARPDVFESNLNLGLLLALAHSPDAATFLRAATQLKPTSHPDDGLARAWSSLAQTLENRHTGEAASCYREALKLRPRDSNLHLALGAVLEQQKDAKGAEAEYQQALELGSADNAGSGDAITALANLYMREKRFAEAEAMLQKLATGRPGDALVHLQLGRVLAAEGKYDEAASALEAGIELAPEDSAAVRDLADVYGLNKKNAEAEPLYRQLLSLRPSDADLHAALGKSLLDQRKFPEAQTEFLAAIKLKPDFGGAYGDLAAAANENKDYPLTIRALDARAKFLPELPIGYFMRASAYDHLKDHKNAAVNYHKFLEVDDGKLPDQEWQARHRLIAIEPKK